MKNVAEFIEKADNGELQLLLSAVEKKLGLGRSDADARALAESEGAPRVLDCEQLGALTSSFANWQAGAGTPTRRRSRTRIWLAYLLLRYGGLRLGEVLALDDRRDFDFARSRLVLPGPPPRGVQMPPDIMREIAALLEEPMFYSLRGEVLRIDPGYLRRKLYERADLAGLPRELASPRVLRHSRARELLDGGVPLKAVQFFLGRAERGRGDGFGSLSPLTGQRIVQDYLNKEVRMKTSARNVFLGKVSAFKRDELLAEVELTTLSGLRIVAVITEESFENLRLGEGSVVTASIKAPWVELAEAPAEGDEYGRTSARNQFPGRVASLKQGGLATEVLVDLNEGSKVCALITGDGPERLGLAPGREVLVLFKAFSVILNAD